MKLFNHVQIKVKDLSISKQFYDPIIKILGYETVLEIDNIVIGYGTSVYDMFEIRQATFEHVLSQFAHIAFNALDRSCVDDFYNTCN